MISVEQSDQHPGYKLISSMDSVEGETKWNSQKQCVNLGERLTNEAVSDVDLLSEDVVPRLKRAVFPIPSERSERIISTGLVLFCNPEKQNAAK